MTWQESLDASGGEPDWRQIKDIDNEANSDGDTSGIDPYKVVLMPDKLNAGFIINKKSNGYYDSEEDFINTYETLIGMSTESGKRVGVSQTGGNTQKIDINYDDESVDPLPSTGSFVFDALSNENGYVVINGEKHEVLPEVERHDEYDPDGETTTTTQSLSGDDWVIDPDIGPVFGGFIGIVNWRAKAHEYIQNGRSTYRTCKFGIYGCEKHIVDPDRIYISGLDRSI